MSSEYRLISGEIRYDTESKEAFQAIHSGNMGFFVTTCRPSGLEDSPGMHAVWLVQYLLVHHDCLFAASELDYIIRRTPRHG